MSSTGSFLSLALVVAANFIPGVGQVASYWLMAAAVAVRVVDSREDMRRAASTARRDSNDAAEDRLEMVDVTPDSPRTLVLGRARAVEGVRRPPWTSGPNDQRLTLVVGLAGHEIDGSEQVYFDEVPVALDAQGWVQTAPYRKTRNETRTTAGAAVLNASGNGSVTLEALPVAGSVSAVWALGSDVAGTLRQGLANVSVAGAVVTVTGGEPGAFVTVTWQQEVATSTARVRLFNGAATQNVGAALAADYPGKITATDRFAGMAVAVVDIDFDPDIYTQGRPTVTVLMRGARVYDPRKDATRGGVGPHRADDPATWEFSECPALHALHYARHPHGLNMPLAELRLADFVQAANACDVPTPLTLRRADGSTAVVTLPRYRCGIVVKLVGDRRGPWEAILKTMAGRWGFAGGTLRIRAGAVPAAKAFELLPSWVAQRLDEGGEPDNSAVVRITNGVTREQRVNRVSGRCFNPDERWQLLPYPAVQDAALIAQDGNTYPLEENYDGVNHPAHAQHLGTIAIRQSQAGLRMQLSCNVSAHRLELFDYGGVTLPRFGMASKGFEVLGWRWHPTEGVQLTLAEMDPAIFVPVAELRGMDPAPNSNLPDPRNVAQVLAVGVVSGTAALTDGSILTRTRVSWDAAMQPGVRNGGNIEVQYAELTAMPASGEWPSWVEQGSATSATIPGLRVGRVYVFRVRAVQGLPLVRGPWSRQVVHQIAAAPLVEPQAGWLNSNVTLGADGRLQGAGGGQVTLPGLGHVVYRCIAAGLTAELAGTPPAPKGLYINGQLAFTGVRSYYVLGIRRSDGLTVYSASFDCYVDPAAPAAMAAALNALNSQHLVVVWSHDEPRERRLNSGLDAAMYRCGASRAVYGSPRFKFQSAYILVGIAGCGEGNGAEAYQGTIDSDPLAWCDLSFAVVNGVLTGVSGTYTPRSLVDYGYTGDLNATAGAPAGTMVGTIPAENVESVAGAQAKANAAAALANAAQQAANAANQALAAIASDSVLSRGEKPQLLLDVDTISAEAAGIDAQAASFGVTVQRTEYAQARTDLFNYLAGLVPAFSDLTADTPINGPVLRGLFGAVYGKRQALLNQISTLAAQRAVWEQVQGVNVTTSQLSASAATEVVEFYQAVGINFSNMA